jgi:hypothetical protein
MEPIKRSFVHYTLFVVTAVATVAITYTPQLLLAAFPPEAAQTQAKFNNLIQQNHAIPY